MSKTYISSSHPKRQQGTFVFVAPTLKTQIPIVGAVFTEQRTTAEKTPFTSITINNIVLGSSVGFYNNSNVLISSDIPTTTSKVYSLQYLGVVNIEIRHGNSTPYYIPWNTQTTLTGAPVSVTALQTLE